MIIHKPTRSVLVRSRDPSKIRSIIPKSKDIAFQGHNVAVKHGVEETKVLRNMGVDVPSPIFSYYDWPGFGPFEHQMATAAFCTYYNRGFILNDMGTGKTASALWAADFLMKEELMQRVMIVSPLSTLNLVWRNEIFQLFPQRTAQVLHGTRQQRFERLAQPVDFYVINHDGLELIERELIARKDIDTLLYDEASVLRNAGTNKWKTMRRILSARPDLRVYLMTGTPCPNSPTDAWALARLVNPDGVPPYFGTFRRKTMSQVSTFKWVPKPEGFKIAYEAMQPAIRYRKEDCLDLPPLTFESREVEATPEQKAQFKEMKQKMVMMANNAVLAGEKIAAVNAADQILKLRQILCGVVKIPNTDKYEVLDHAPRLNALIECIEEAKAKVFVIVPFKGIIQTLADELSPHFTCEVVNGDVSKKQRDEIIGRFKSFQDPRVLLCHPKVVSHGLNLTEADTMVFFAPIYSNDEFLQSIERFNRPGQKHKMTVIKLGAHKLEWQLYASLENKKKMQDTILEMYTELVA